MNTNQLKRFAREARIKLLDQVRRKLEFVLTQDSAELRGKASEIAQLKSKIAQIGKEQVIETVAYTWFNRLMALRFMDANGYTVPKVVTPLPGMTHPEILHNALSGHIEENLQLDGQRLNDLIDGRTAVEDPQREAYRMLLVAACNSWHTAMPFIFERIHDYTELLLPDDLLSDYSIVADVRNGMSDEDCRQEEVIGWLYQFYIADKKDEVFAGLKKNIKITPENIPAATQLFTPRWIVRYMVENTVGKLWLSLKPNSRLREHMPYYIEAPEGNPPAPLPEGLKSVADMTFLDPCMGSGHILVYAFELFTKIYEEEGYNTNEIPALILQHNLFGIDIDERATQLAAFALTMKARSYYSRFLKKPVQPHVIALENIDEDTIQHSVHLPLTVNGKKIETHTDLSLHLLTQADNYGSLIKIAPEEAAAIQVQEGSMWQEEQQKLTEQAEYLSRQYFCVVTNPPYMGSGSNNEPLLSFAKIHYSNSKSDLFSMFIERCINFAFSTGYAGMVTMQSWMFLSSYEALRREIISNYYISTLIQIGYNSFPELNSKVVQACAFTIAKVNSVKTGTYFDLNSAPQSANKEKIFLHNILHKLFFTPNQNDFKKIPGAPLAYQLSQYAIELFTKQKLAKVTKPLIGMRTGDNNKFLRLWHEMELNKSSFGASDNKWFPYAKGGEFRKWYGNYEYLVNWENDGFEIKSDTLAKYPQLSWDNLGWKISNEQSFFKKAISWTAVSSGPFNARFVEVGSLFDTGGSFMVPDDNLIFYELGFLNSIVFQFFVGTINPTINYGAGTVGAAPFIIGNQHKNDIEVLVKKEIEISKFDWNSRETSWDFKTNEILRQEGNLLKTSFESFKNEWTEKFYELHRNEEELNRQFIEIYGLQDELTPDVPLVEITILQEEAKIIDGKLFIDPVPVMLQLISYAVGCIFGRYRPDQPGLILANAGETLQDFLKELPSPRFMPDEDNIIPVLDGEWFTDDIAGRFRLFLKTAFGEEHFEENLKFIEDTIGRDIRRYFVKDFYNDHIRRYKKRPIYWMFSSPKGHFKALIYMHRYQPDLCSKMLNDYLQAYISKLEAAKQTATMLSLREDISAREKTLALKEIDRLEAMLKDCRDYAKTLHTTATQKIGIDLDDGVKVNYQKFKEVLVPIKGLEKEEE